MSAVTGVVTEVRAAHRLDEPRLAAWLDGRLPGFDRSAGLRVRQFEGGQSNPTYLLESRAPAAGQGAPSRWVLRKKPPGVLLASAHQVEREHRVLAALHGTDVPVPEPLALCEDPSVVGTTFFVMQYVDGRLLRDPALPDASPPERRALHDAATRTLARLHAARPEALGLADYGKPTGYVARQVKRWAAQYAASKTRDIPAMDWLVAWLPEHVPAEGPVSVVHGDFRIDNLVFAREAPTVRAVLDWELSTLGEPLAELAYHCLAYRLPAGRPGLPGLAGLDLRALGIPSEAETIATYAEARGIAPPAPAVHATYLAFGLFRLAAIVQGVMARLAQGNASSAEAATVGAQAEAFAELARSIAESGR